MPAITAEQAASRRRTNAKILKFGCLPLAALFILVIVLAALGDDQDDDKPTKEARVEAPAYTEANKSEKAKTGRVDLVIPDATVDQAKAAIDHYAQTIGDRFKNYGITVVRSDADKTYVCMGEWVRDADAAELYTGGRITSDTWPAIAYNCPDPKG
ncbi:hypothetical protein [Streptomyces sp. ECR3.8]|uniref:hypothetical protein n=1 Tax=Streptomyces sp. ECR3.8 TaxID=3461009 RepID=UPI004042A3FB